MARVADRGANDALRTRLDEVYRQYARLRDGMGQLQQRLASVRLSAESEDRLVVATVGARGQLIDLRLDPAVYRKHDPDSLAATIVATVAAATQRVGAEIAAAMAEYLPPDSPTLQYLRSGDLNAMAAAFAARTTTAKTDDQR